MSGQLDKQSNKFKIESKTIICVVESEKLSVVLHYLMNHWSQKPMLARKQVGIIDCYRDLITEYNVRYESKSNKQKTLSPGYNYG